jgi:hypothetical protein
MVDPKTKLTDIQSEILTALGKSKNHQNGRSFVTAYQLLRLLPQKTRQKLNDEYGKSGKGAGQHFSAANFVAKAAASYPKLVEVQRLDTRGMRIEVDGNQVESGTQICGLFRLRRE